MLLSAAMVLMPAVAQADNGQLLVDVLGDSVGFTDDPGPVLFADNLMPGDSSAGTLLVRNASTEDVTLAITASDVQDVENSCEHSEADTTGERCDEDGGELSSRLRLMIRHGSEQSWSGSLAELERGLDIIGGVAANGTLRLELKVELPYSAGNDTMSDSTSFALRLVATGQSSPDTVVAGVHFGPPESSGLLQGPQLPLPVTGATVNLWLLLLAGMTLIVTGGALLMGSRRRTRILLGN
jgi:LPXTG-motif cell wall-anchored protein